MEFFSRHWRCLVVTWQLIKETKQIVYGMYRITRIPTPCVSIFGGSRLTEDSYYAKQAEELAYKLVQRNIGILTGGGPGIMQAASCGALRASGGRTDMFMGIIVTGMKDEAPSKCGGDQIILDYFFARKWLLINYSIGFVIFPGGLGTIDELSDLLNLMQTGKLPQTTVVLIGTEFWKSYQDWVAIARKNAYLSSTREPKVFVTDDIDAAVERIVTYCEQCTTHRRV
jgi:uncharacterized protein (TIGR00730 family)